MTWAHWLAEIDAHDGAGVVKRYYANGNGFVTKPSDSPASTFYDARIQQPVNLNRALFTGPSTYGAARVGYGELVLLNGDGALDELNDLGLDGQQIRILRSEVARPTYADFDEVIVGTMEQPEFQNDVVRIKLRDNRFQLAVPLQRTKYSGAGLGTLEGTESDLKDRPKPLCYGTVRNIAPPCVETAKKIYQVHDGVATPTMVYDNGVKLSFSFPVSLLAASTGALGATNGTTMVRFRQNTAGDIKTTTDGITFTARTTAWTSGDIAAGIIWAPSVSLFIAYGYKLSGTNRATLMTSPDGITWTLRTIAIAMLTLTDISDDGNGHLVGTGSGTNSIISSTDGINWTARTSPLVNSGSIRSVASKSGRFVLVGDSGPDTTHLEAAYSTDGGVTWTRFTIEVPLVSGTPAGAKLRYQLGLFVGSTSQGVIFTSADGVNWITTKITLDLSGGGGTTNVSITALRDSHFIGFTSAPNTGAITSKDGASWVPLSIGSAVGVGNLIDVCFFNDEVYVGAAGSNLYKSTGSGGAYASQSDLLNDTLAPLPGTFKVWTDASGSYFRLGAEPAGQITADVTQGATAADRTVAQVFAQLLDREGYTADAGDLTALDAAAAGVIGLYEDQESLLADACDAVAQSAGAAWYIDRAGAFRLAQLTLASGSPAVVLTSADLLAPPARLTTSDPGRGLPNYRVIVRWGKNYTVQTSDVAAGVSAATRAFIRSTWRETKQEDLSVQTQHLLSPELIIETLLAGESDAIAEATRLLTLRKTRRDRILVPVDYTQTNAEVDLMGVVSLTHDRLGLSGGKLFRVIAIESDAAANVLRWNLWG